MASCSYRHIARLQNRPTPLGFDFSRSLQWIAIGQPERQRRTGFAPNIPTPRSDRPKSFCDELFFFSSASLESVTGLRTCQEGGAITGMVLRYSNNTEESLGWVRADRLGYLQEVCPDGLWILVTFFPKLPYKYPWVTKITVNIPSVDLHKYLAITWRGQLERWFSRRQCRLYHDGQSTPVVQTF